MQREAGQPQSQQLLSIQVLRAFAAILVVYAHAIDRIQIIYPNPIVHLQGSFLENIGAVGVDIFFVISGFVITYIVRASPISPGRFVAKRIARIYPIYYLIFIIVMGKAIFWNDLSITPENLVNSLLLIPIFPKIETPLLSTTWTLYFEVFFYFCGFLILCLQGRKYFAPILCATLGLLVLLKPSHYGSFSLVWIATNPIILEFGAGCLIAELYSRLQISNKWNFLALGGTILGFLYLILYGYGPIDDCRLTLAGTHSFPRIILFGIPSALLVFAAVNLEKNGFNAWPDFAVKLGDSSYCLYLLHTSLLWYPAKLLFKLGQKSPDLSIVLTVAFAVLAAHLVHGYVERPMQQWIGLTFFAKKNTHFTPRRGFPARSGAGPDP